MPSRRDLQRRSRGSAGKPEPLDRRPRKRVHVPYEHLTEIVAALPPLLPEGSPFGFNVHHETRRAWIVVGEDVDAAPLVAELVAAAAGPGAE